MTAEDLLRGLLEGAETGLSGQQVLDALLELGVQRRLLARGTLVERDGVRHFTRNDDELRAEVRGLLGDCAGDPLDDPRWRTCSATPDEVPDADRGILGVWNSKASTPRW